VASSYSPGWPGRRRIRSDRVVLEATRASLKVMPRLPERAMPLLAGGRSLTVEGNVLDPMLYLLRTGQRLLGSDGLVVDDDLERTRSQSRTLAEAIGGADLGVEVTDLTVAGPGGSIPVRHYRSAESAGAPVVVFFHGGGFVIGDLETYDAVCSLVAHQAGVHVLSVDYRLAPEHRASAAVEDAIASYRWARDHAEELGADPHRVAVAGDSAGGNLAAVVSQQIRDKGLQPPTLQCLIYPIVDFTAQTRSRTLFAEGFFLTKHDMDWFQNHYLGGSGIVPTDPIVSPLLAHDLSNLPPALVVTAGFDPLRDEGDQYADALRAAGVAVDHRRMGTMTHLFVNYAPLGGGPGRAMSEINSALRAHLAHC
jgi:acetyl esterase